MIIPQVLDQLEPSGVRSARTPDGKVVVYEITTGRQFRRFPDSAADMVASGRFSPVWPPSSAPTVPVAPLEPATPLVEPPPLLTAATEAAVASAKRRQRTARANGGGAHASGHASGNAPSDAS